MSRPIHRGFIVARCLPCGDERLTWLGFDGQTRLCIVCDAPVLAPRGAETPPVLRDVTEGMPDDAPCGGCGSEDGGCGACGPGGCGACDDEASP